MELSSSVLKTLRVSNIVDEKWSRFHFHVSARYYAMCVLSQIRHLWEIRFLNTNSKEGRGRARRVEIFLTLKWLCATQCSNQKRWIWGEGESGAKQLWRLVSDGPLWTEKVCVSCTLYQICGWQDQLNQMWCTSRRETKPDLWELIVSHCFLASTRMHGPLFALLWHQTAEAASLMSCTGGLHLGNYLNMEYIPKQSTSNKRKLGKTPHQPLLRKNKYAKEKKTDIAVVIYPAWTIKRLKSRGLGKILMHLLSIWWL